LACGKYKGVCRVRSWEAAKRRGAGPGRPRKPFRRSNTGRITLEPRTPTSSYTWWAICSSSQVGCSAMTCLNRSFHSPTAAFKTLKTMYGVDIAPVAPCSMA